jgi:hypothetical protein
LPKLLAELENGWDGSQKRCSREFVQALDNIDSGWVTYDGAQKGFPNLIRALIDQRYSDFEVAWIVPVLDRISPDWGNSNILHGALAKFLTSYNDDVIPGKVIVLPRIHRIVEHCASRLTIEELLAVTRLSSYKTAVWVESTTTFPDEPNGYTARYSADSDSVRYLARDELKRRGAM